MKREEERKKEKRRERDYCCIVTANALPIHFAYYRMQIAKRDCRGRKGGNRLFELGVVSVWWLTENKFRPVSNSTDPRAITSPMFRIGRRGNPGCECKTKASHYEIKPPATRSVHSKINRNRFPSFSPILGEKSNCYRRSPVGEFEGMSLAGRGRLLLLLLLLLWRCCCCCCWRSKGR